MRIRRSLSIILMSALLLSMLSSCSQEKKSQPKTRTYYEYFDTVSTVFSYAEDSDESFLAICDATEAILEKYHKLFDIYYEYSGINNLKTINNNAGKAAVSVERELIDFLLYAKEMHALTGGEMNIAFGSVTALWHDCREDADDDPSQATVPTEEQLLAAAEHVSIDSVVIDEDASTVYISDPYVRLDVGALGKGYATEMAARQLEERGAFSYVLNIGGNIRAIGAKPDGTGWVTGITNPDKSSDESFATKVTLRDTSCVTSGNYERYYTVDGVNYHHIIDRDTLSPARYFASVTVITKNSALADALSTALFCMPYAEGLSLCESLGVDAIWIYESGELCKTESLTLS